MKPQKREKNKIEKQLCQYLPSEESNKSLLEEGSCFITLFIMIVEEKTASITFSELKN